VRPASTDVTGVMTPAPRCTVDVVAREDVEAEVRRLCTAGDIRAAATVAIRDLGPEVAGFLMVLARDPTDAGDIFADVCVRIWKNLAGFRWQCTLRTWVYVLARRAFAAHQQQRAQWRDRHLPISEVPEIEELIVRVRTTTLARLHGEPQTRAQRLREQLSADEQTLLTLRLDRDLEWREIARVLADPSADEPSDHVIGREAAALRKQFERVKERLKRLAAE
jgi:RNA polymerase sigma-70 factor (ECF subfamily)